MADPRALNPCRLCEHDSGRVFFTTYELKTIQAALGGPYKSSGWLTSGGLSSLDSLKLKVDEELAHRTKDEDVPGGTFRYGAPF